MENTTLLQINAKHPSNIHLRCIAYFVPRLDGEDDVREEGLRSDGAVERDDTSQERPEDHQDVDVSAGRPWLEH